MNKCVAASDRDGVLDALMVHVAKTDQADHRRSDKVKQRKVLGLGLLRSCLFSSAFCITMFAFLTRMVSFWSLLCPVDMCCTRRTELLHEGGTKTHTSRYSRILFVFLVGLVCPVWPSEIAGCSPNSIGPMFTFVFANPYGMPNTKHLQFVCLPLRN